MKWKYDKGLKVITAIFFVCIWINRCAYSLIVGNVYTSNLIVDFICHPISTLLISSSTLAFAIFWLVHAVKAYKKREDSFKLTFPRSLAVFVLAYIPSIIITMLIARDYLFPDRNTTQIFSDTEGMIVMTDMQNRSVELTERQTNNIEQYIGIMIKDCYEVENLINMDNPRSPDQLYYQIYWNGDKQSEKIVIGNDWMTIDGTRYVLKEGARYGNGFFSAISRLAEVS